MPLLRSAPNEMINNRDLVEVTTERLQTETPGSTNKFDSSWKFPLEPPVMQPVLQQLKTRRHSKNWIIQTHN
jgi:hypothetical protein